MELPLAKSCENHGPAARIPPELLGVIGNGPGHLKPSEAWSMFGRIMEDGELCIFAILPKCDPAPVLERLRAAFGDADVLNVLPGVKVEPVRDTCWKAWQAVAEEK